ncbi:MAG: indole-3-glycerol phosphate synthase TrpC [Candidatus Amulumruptor caecigallinarius]|uniref:indole-3-glycerol-phosphate synthase n=1 Tax=Candidatus Amulumruptor caecigallinarius TaxID=2109911 RepID=A0A4Q0UAT5_9BACT|nr:MAG: indole-3-glycerol phosphate synthase TrpC [Candidatus Amulumruptor caecigallinarius]HJE39468.1 indole-3-glycerol phosphate synthase TrpC [Candidatus Amulumruptor caecigallinarius]
MANILDEIIANKRREIDAEIKRVGGIPDISGSMMSPSMKSALINSQTGIIAEFKRRSPSKGEIHPKAMVNDIIPGYEQAGAAACSVLTDTPYFGGSLTDLAVASSLVSMPLLRKDFTVSEFQIAQARLYGASAVLLIAAVLSAEEMQRFTRYAHANGLEVLVEVHNVAELDKLPTDADMVGVNNRDLTTFRTDPTLSLHIASLLPDNVVKVAESGLTSISEVNRLRDAGYRGFLIGETFMRHDHPADALRRFLSNEL